ncbi:uncharacterized protein LOC128962307 [Oppia nitens]|uniref:uncharacterized protein LOC128962307 n=1 Tax=Oppia nitens TaxID=1686743 RepID=UPI0023DCAF15|nr:uncharacterized protein LOC128962307 [Oppia nitens]
MRYKHLLLCVVSIGVTTVLYCLLVASDGRHRSATLDSINRQLSQWKGVVIRDQSIKSINNIFIFNNNHNYNPGAGSAAAEPNNASGEESERKCRQYLRTLGLIGDRNGTEVIVDDKSQSVITTTTTSVQPVFVTAVTGEQSDLAIGFLKSFQNEFIAGLNTNYTLIVYDLGLSQRQFNKISSICNETQTQNLSKSSDIIMTIPSSMSSSASTPITTTSTTTTTTTTGHNTNSNNNNSIAGGSGGQLNNWCTIRRFEYDLFPPHVYDHKLHAYRPIILQLVLAEFGAAFWLDPNYLLLPSAVEKVNSLATRARQSGGVLSWTIEQPTSSLTHPKMFDYFKTVQNEYYFHRMVKPSHILLYNTGRIHKQLMLPWIRCTLTPECIAPIGSQASGCRFDKKPLYRYSGCHHYDTSALNIVLGQLFDYSETPYSAPEDDKFFKVNTLDDEEMYTDSGGGAGGDTDISVDAEYVSSAAAANYRTIGTAVGADHRPQIIRSSGSSRRQHIQQQQRHQ